MSKINLCVLGKRYNDTTVCVDELSLGETNQCYKVDNRLGGMYNIEREQDAIGIRTTLLPQGTKRAIIINESSGSRRSSIVRDIETDAPSCFLTDYNEWIENYPYSLDWLHVAYADDIDFDIPEAGVPISLDFCTNQPREKYRRIIDRATIVFDSRERAGLYTEISTKTPLVLHDHFGSECIINGEVTFKSTVVPTEGLEVNGAGDIFAGIFIKEYLDNGMKSAVEISSNKTTEILRGSYVG